MTVIIQLQYNVKYKLTELDFLPISLEENRLSGKAVVMTR